MTTARALNLKPSCAHEIHAFPADHAAQLWETIARLVHDPLPDGDHEHEGDLHRLCVADHHLVYRFGETWLRLLALRPRAGADEAAESRPPFVFSTAAPPAPAGLPRPITPEWLASLRIAERCFPALVACATEDDLLTAPVPAAALERIVANLFPKPLAQVLDEPDLAVQDARDLARFKEGALPSFQLRLDPEQGELAASALEGPAMVRGGAGTGKSTAAMYRVRAGLRRPGATGKETALVIAYTRAQEAASHQLLGQILTPEETKRVCVATVDDVALGIVRRYRAVGRIERIPREVLAALREDFVPAGPTILERKARARALDRVGDHYLADEIHWILEGRGLRTLEEYQAAERPGRGVAFSAKLRAAVWELYELYRARLAADHLETWGALRLEALNAVRGGREPRSFDQVVIDDAQDLPPVALSLLANLCRTKEGVFLAADTKQSLYACGASFVSADPQLPPAGRTAVLARNHRSTAEIDGAAFELRAEEPGKDAVASTSPRRGPLPVLLRDVRPEREGKWAARFIRQAARHLRVPLHAAAVLVPNLAAGHVAAEAVRGAGLAAQLFEARNLDPAAPVVKVLTFQSAKGLEFPVVVLGGLAAQGHPHADEYDEPAAYQEALLHHRRLLYVACTRATRALMVMARRGPLDPVLAGLSAERWSVQEAS